MHAHISIIEGKSAEHQMIQASQTGLQCLIAVPHVSLQKPLVSLDVFLQNPPVIQNLDMKQETHFPWICCHQGFIDRP